MNTETSNARELLAKWQKELSVLTVLPAGLSWYDRGVIEGRKIAAAELEAALAAEGARPATDPPVVWRFRDDDLPF